MEVPRLHFLASTTTFLPIEIGVFKPEMTVKEELSAGEVGYIATGLKDLTLARVGDTLSFAGSKIMTLPGYKEPKPMVYLSIFPTNNDDFLLLRQSMEKLFNMAYEEEDLTPFFNEEEPAKEEPEEDPDAEEGGEEIE